MPSNVCKMYGFTSSCTCAKYRPGICSLLKHSLVSNNSYCGQLRSWSDCADAQADLGLRCPHSPKTRFCKASQIYSKVNYGQLFNRNDVFNVVIFAVYFILLLINNTNTNYKCKFSNNVILCLTVKINCLIYSCYPSIVLEIREPFVIIDRGQ